MAVASLSSPSRSHSSNSFPMVSPPRTDDKLQSHPFTTTSPSQNQESTALGNATSAIQDSSSTTFRRLRSSLEQSLRSTTRSRVKAPLSADFGTITKTSKGHDDSARHEQGKVTRKFSLLKRLETKVGLRLARQDSTTAPSTPVTPGGDQANESRVHVNNADTTSGRVAGWRGFMTPSLRQGSVSSPTLHLSSQALLSSGSQALVMSPSLLQYSGLFSPSRDRTRRASAHPAAREISAPQPLAPRRALRNDSVSPERPGASPRTNKHCPSPVPIPAPRPSLSSTNRNRDLPSPPRSPNPPSTGSRGQNGKSARQPGSANASQVSLSSQQTPSVPGRAVSPIHTRTTTRRIVTPTSNRGGPSSSTPLPSDAGSVSTSPTPSRRPSADSAGRPSLDTTGRPSPQTVRRGSADTQRRVASPAPRAVSPAGTARSRAASPSQRTLVYTHTRGLNMSAASLTSSSTPEQRELIRLATSVLCKELRKPPPHLSLPGREKEWAEVEVHLQPLIRVERIWGKSGAISSASSSQVAVAGVSTTVVSSAGEERERKLFHEALRDGVILCQ